MKPYSFSISLATELSWKPDARAICCTILSQCKNQTKRPDVAASSVLPGNLSVAWHGDRTQSDCKTHRRTFGPECRKLVVSMCPRNIAENIGRYGVFTWSILQDVKPHDLRLINNCLFVIYITAILRWIFCKVKNSVAFRSKNRFVHDKKYTSIMRSQSCFDVMPKVCRWCLSSFSLSLYFAQKCPKK